MKKTIAGSVIALAILISGSSVQAHSVAQAQSTGGVSIFREISDIINSLTGFTAAAINATKVEATEEVPNTTTETSEVAELPQIPQKVIDTVLNLKDSIENIVL